jgi:multidrug resistance efflux pump
VALFLAAAVWWSISARLATSVQAGGHLVSWRPSYEIQHPYGGRIGEVLVAEHQEVREGDLLIRMDAAEDQAHLREVQTQIAGAQDETAAARLYLADPQAAAASAQSPAGLRLAAMYRPVLLEAQAAHSNAAALRRQAEALQARVAAGQDQRASMRERFERQLTLVEKGSFRAAEQDRLFEALMTLEGEISGDAAEIIALSNQAAQQALAAAGARARFRLQLLETVAGNERRLPELNRQRIDLENRIAAAAIRAPADGVVSGLSFDTLQMYAPRGETLLTLNLPGPLYRAAFVIPPHQIDQVYPGMEGRLTLTGLPQRNLPKVSARILSVSPSVRRDGEGAPVGYDGLAELSRSDVEALKTVAPEGMRFSVDMPLSLTFPGREVTFAEYLVAPFFGFLAKALQD